MSPMPAPQPINESPLKIDVCGDDSDLARHAAELFVTLAGRALGARRQFAVALAGGRTPARLYELLTLDNYAYQVVWPAVQVFWSDERCVPPAGAASNYRMAHETLLSRVPIPEENIHRMKGEDDPSGAAAAYERVLRAQYDGTPRLDLVLLGMGADGHVASLFPGGAALEEEDRLVTTATDPAGLPRLTFTLPLINAARTVAILVSGSDKAEIVRRVLGSGARDEGLPAQRVRPSAGRLLWILDEPAASLLDPSAA